MIRAKQLKLIESHVKKLRTCAMCPEMFGPVVSGGPVVSEIILVGQAPGDKEPKLGRPFAWTAGKNLFKWMASIGVDEPTFRASVYMAAVCRCFPGKNPKGGDRVPSDPEIENCSGWMEKEIQLLEPKLIIPVGKLAISQFLPDAPLVETIGQQPRIEKYGVKFDIVPLPHPSGASTWYHTDPGKSLTRHALALIAKHPSWKKISSAD